MVRISLKGWLVFVALLFCFSFLASFVYDLCTLVCLHITFLIDLVCLLINFFFACDCNQAILWRTLCPTILWRSRYLWVDTENHYSSSLYCFLVKGNYGGRETVFLDLIDGLGIAWGICSECVSLLDFLFLCFLSVPCMLPSLCIRIAPPFL